MTTEFAIVGLSVVHEHSEVKGEEDHAKRHERSSLPTCCAQSCFRLP